MYAKLECEMWRQFLKDSCEEDILGDNVRLVEKHCTLHRRWPKNRLHHRDARKVVENGKFWSCFMHELSLENGI